MRNNFVGGDYFEPTVFNIEPREKDEVPHPDADGYFVTNISEDRVLTLDSEHLGAMVERFKIAARPESDTHPDCPGARGLTGYDLNRLDTLVACVKAKAAACAPRLGQ